MKKEKVLVAMSGGVDSSAVCLLLQAAGYDVAGMTMRVWDVPRQFSDGHDEPDFVREAQALAARLGIPHTVVDVREEFRNAVVRYFLDEYTAGARPTPASCATATSSSASWPRRPTAWAAATWRRATT